MAKTVDFNKMRKRRQRTQTLRRLLALAAVMAGIAGVLALNNLLIEEEIPTRIGDVIESFGGSGYPVAVPGGIIRDVKNVGDNLAVLNDTNLYLYNAKGKLLNNIQQMGETGVVRTSASRVLAFDAGKKRYGIYSKSRQLLEQTLEHGIINAAINDRGDYAIVSSSNQFVAETYVYNRQNTEIFYWSSADHLVLDVAISPKGDRMAVIFRFDSDKEEDVQRLELSDDMLLCVDFPESDRITVLTDKRYVVLDSHAKEKGSYQFGEKHVAASETYGRDILLLLDSRDNKAKEVVLLGADGRERSSTTLEKPVRDMALARDRVYLLTEDGIITYTYKMQLKSKHDERGIRVIHSIGSKLYYMTEEEILVLGAPRNADAQSSAPEASVSETLPASRPAPSSQPEEPPADEAGSMPPDIEALEGEA